MAVGPEGQNRPFRSRTLLHPPLIRKRFFFSTWPSLWPIRTPISKQKNRIDSTPPACEDGGDSLWSCVHSKYGAFKEHGSFTTDPVLEDTTMTKRHTGGAKALKKKE